MHFYRLLKCFVPAANELVATSVKRFSLGIMLLTLWGCAALPEHYASLHKQTTVGFSELLSDIEHKRVVFVGEGHSTSEDHIVQLEIIRYLHEKGRKVAVALEMFPVGSQPVLTKWSNGALNESDFAREYARAWSLPYSYYRDIFTYTRQKGIPLFGINAERSAANHVAKHGIRSVPEETRTKLKFTSCEEEPEYKGIMHIYEGKAPHAMGLSFMCDAQRLRDAVMAHTITGILKEGPYTVVVLVGSAHASKAAVPEMLKRHTEVSSAVLMPRSFGELMGRTVSASIADYLWY